MCLRLGQSISSDSVINFGNLVRDISTKTTSSSSFNCTKQIKPALLRQQSQSLPSLHNKDVLWNKSTSQTSKRIDVKIETQESEIVASPSHENSFIPIVEIKRDLSLQWNPRSRIQVLKSNKEIISCMDKIKNNTERWKRTELSESETRADRPVSTNKRYKETVRILKFLKEKITSKRWGCLEEGAVIGSFTSNGQPVGLLALYRDSIPEIELVVTDPNSRGYGAALIQDAVQQSERWGENGKLVLRVESKSMKSFYTKLGFVPREDADNFTLNPQKDLILVPAKRSDLWDRRNNIWHLKKH